jgi:UDP-glucose 4-epimerase
VTGGAGFIGSHLVDRLIAEGYEVIVLDNFSTGKIENVQHHLNNQKFNLVKGDVQNSGDVNKAIKDADVVFHLAAFVNVPLSIENPMLANNINIRGTLNLLQASLKKNIVQFIYVSTCAAYGEACYLPISEEHPTAPLSPYGISKLAAEQYCKVFNRTFGLKTVGLRYFNVYGPRQFKGPYSAVITHFIDRLRENEPPIIYGNGEQTRDFLYVEDAVEACMLSLSSENCVGEVINIGTGIKTTINELANLLIKLMKKAHIAPMYAAPRKEDIKHSCAKISKAQKMLGYKPKVTLEKGLKRLLNEDKCRQPF